MVQPISVCSPLSLLFRRTHVIRSVFDLVRCLQTHVLDIHQKQGLSSITFQHYVTGFRRISARVDYVNHILLQYLQLSEHRSPHSHDPISCLFVDLQDERLEHHKGMLAARR